MDFNLAQLGDTTFRSIVSLVVLFIVTKLIGKKQVSELSLFDYVIGISIGNFAAELSINLETNLINGSIAVIIFGIVAYIVSLISLKSMSFRRFFFGVPTVIIQDGKILINSMKECKIDMNDLLEQARIAGYFDISEIAYAIMESNGSMSFLPYDKFERPNKADLSLKTRCTGLYANVVIDSKIIEKSLENIGKDRDWLFKELKKKRIYDLDDILLVTVSCDDKINVFMKNSSDYEKKVLE